ncbi:hypothetical protein BLOT_007042 [Blomia tropicalis]|nr:hypothetical protein BLOT_007042 [Blomia tropicalis]
MATVVVQWFPPDDDDDGDGGGGDGGGGDGGGTSHQQMATVSIAMTLNRPILCSAPTCTTRSIYTIGSIVHCMTSGTE